jgi:hypothetical protein
MVKMRKASTSRLCRTGSRKYQNESLGGTRQGDKPGVSNAEKSDEWHELDDSKKPPCPHDTCCLLLTAAGHAILGRGS